MPAATHKIPEIYTHTCAAARAGGAPAVAPRPSKAHPPPSANAVEGGDDSALSVFGFGDDFTSLCYDPAEHNECRQLLAASRHARRRAGNHELEAARARHSPSPANEAAAQRRDGNAALSRTVTAAAQNPPLS
jgi:hypothetical protein